MSQLIRSMASGAFKPTKFSGCALWLAADKGVTTVDGNVSSWADQSGNNRHATQDIVANRPTVVSNSLNGRPVIDCATQGMTFDASNMLDSTFTVISVMRKKPTQSAFNPVFNLYKPAPNKMHLVANSWSSNIYQFKHFSGYQMNGASYDYGWDSYEMDYTGALGQAWTVDSFSSSSSGSYWGYSNGLQITSGSAGAFFASLSALTLGGIGKNLDSGTYGDCQTAEVIIFNRALTDAERVRVEQYLSGKYAITLS